MKKPIKSTQPKEIPILFSTDMVKNIMADRKTETRRTRGLDMYNKKPNDYFLFPTSDGFGAHRISDFESSHAVNCPYGQPGDILWVRETHAFFLDAILYKADGEGVLKCRKWKPSIHMPKAYARIWLSVKNLSLQRVQELTVDQIKAEGVRIPIDKGGVVFNISDDHSAFNYLSADYWVSTTTPEERTALLYRAFWAELWVSINGPASWHQNPWVWVVKFKVLSTTGRPLPTTQDPLPTTHYPLPKTNN